MSFDCVAIARVFFLSKVSQICISCGKATASSRPSLERDTASTSLPSGQLGSAASLARSCTNTRCPAATSRRPSLENATAFTGNGTSARISRRSLPLPMSWAVGRSHRRTRPSSSDDTNNLPSAACVTQVTTVRCPVWRCRGCPVSMSQKRTWLGPQPNPTSVAVARILPLGEMPTTRRAGASAAKFRTFVPAAAFHTVIGSRNPLIAHILPSGVKRQVVPPSSNTSPPLSSRPDGKPEPLLVTNLDVAVALNPHGNGREILVNISRS